MLCVTVLVTVIVMLWRFELVVMQLSHPPRPPSLSLACWRWPILASGSPHLLEIQSAPPPSLPAQPSLSASDHASSSCISSSITPPTTQNPSSPNCKLLEAVPTETPLQKSFLPSHRLHQSSIVASHRQHCVQKTHHHGESDKVSGWFVPAGTTGRERRERSGDGWMG